MLNISFGTEKNRQTIHEKSLHLLENNGVAFHYEPALKLLRENGAKIDDSIAHIPATLVQQCLDTCPSSFTFQARDNSKCAHFGSKEDFLVLPNLGPVFIQENGKQRRNGTMTDYINITKLSHASPVVDVVGSCPIDAVDTDPKSKFLQMVYQACRHSNKPVMCCTGAPDVTDQQLDLVEMSFEQPGIMDEKVITGTSLSPLSPLAYSEEAAHAIMAFAARGQMVIFAGAPMSGISAPVSIAGTTLVINTEFLAGMVLAQCIKPGSPVVYAITASAGNLRNASYVTGVPETTLLNCFAAQMGQYYHVPTRSVGAVTDAKTIDMQAGFEAMQNLLMARLSGIDAIYETLGTLDSLMSVSYEKFMIDLELISRVKNITRGVDDSPDQLYCQEIEQIGIGGNFLTHPSTFEACRQRWAPTVSDWWPYDKWVKEGSQDLNEKAAILYKEMLQQAPESVLNSDTDKRMLNYIEKSKQ